MTDGELDDRIPATRVELTVSARNILNMDFFSKSDPMCVLYIRDRGANDFKEYGRTETIMDNLNPDFVKKFEVIFMFEEVQHMKFELYNVNSDSPNLKNHDFLGSMECTMGEILGKEGRLTKPLSGLSTNRGTITVVAEELSKCKDMITLHFEGEHLDKMDTFGKSDPFLVFYRCNTDQTCVVCHKTEVIKKTLNPKWKPFKIMLRSLCNAEYDRELKVECYDWNRDGSHELIGMFKTTARELTRGPNRLNKYQLINPKKKQKSKSYKDSGVVSLIDVKIEPQFTFLDYIKLGCELNVTVAIDFTASNGDPRQPTSLHYIHPSQPNHYMRALQAVGEIIQEYDSDKLFPALGFGAKLENGEVSHEFFLNGRADSPYCNGINGVVEAYKNALQTVQLFGPTHFAPVVNHVSKFAAAKRDGTAYFILLIITDGVITDMAKTKEAIVQAAMLPLSIIIVGVGNEDFSNMVELDGDDVRVSYNGCEAQRDIVQFVPFREFDQADNVILSQAQLAKEVLAEIPDQFLSYMQSADICPKALKRYVATKKR